MSNFGRYSITHCLFNIEGKIEVLNSNISILLISICRLQQHPSLQYVQCILNTGKNVELTVTNFQSS